MKKKLLSILALCIVIFSIFTFTGCAVTLSGGPSKTDPVTGNGSMTVRKGDYLYFVNGYVSNKDLKGSDNNYGNAKNGAIYRAQLQNGELMYDVTTNEDGDEVKTLKNVELLVPKVAGFEYTSLYIFDTTLYFTSPNTEKDTTGKIRFDLTDIYAVSIKGGDITKLANAVNIDGVEDFGFANIDNKVYLTYLNGSKLYIATINGTKLVKTKLISDKVSSFVSNIESGYVYYTRSFNDSENSKTGNVLAKADIKIGAETIIIKDNYNTFTVKDIKDNKLYYTRTNTLITNSYIYSQPLNDFDVQNEKQYTAVAYTSNQYIFDLGEGYTNGIIVNENNKLQILTGIDDIEKDIVLLYDGEFTILGIHGANVYGKDAEGNIVRVNIQNKNLEVLVSKDIAIDTAMKVNFDYESGYAYYYVKYTGDDNKSGFYLNRTYTNQNEKVNELVGIVLEEHIKTENND